MNSVKTVEVHLNKTNSYIKVPAEKAPYSSGPSTVRMLNETLAHERKNK